MSLSRDDVVTAALALSDAQGADALSLRSLATALGVQAPSLYTHVRSKADLLDALGDRILDEVLAELPAPNDSTDWREWLLRAARQLRAVLLRHTDGAWVVARARSSLRRGDFSELAATALIGAGVPRRDARLYVMAVERFVVGWVLEEQSLPTENAPPPALDQLVARFPNLTSAIGEYFESGSTVDDLFDDEVRLILRG